MGYIEAIEATGVEVVESKSFGSYQGEEVALLADGRVIIYGFGSCAGCDNWENFVGSPGRCKEHVWAYPQPVCADCAAWQERVREFGQGYVDDALTVGSDEWKRVMGACEKQAEWGYDDSALYKYLKQIEERTA